MTLPDVWSVASNEQLYAAAGSGANAQPSTDSSQSFTSEFIRQSQLLGIVPHPIIATAESRHKRLQQQNKENNAQSAAAALDTNSNNNASSAIAAVAASKSSKSDKAAAALAAQEPPMTVLTIHSHTVDLPSLHALTLTLPAFRHINCLEFYACNDGR
jgi:hypothetical protein